MVTYPNLYHLKYFADAVALGSISAAAQKNLVTHPAISRAISALERHLETELLVHQKKNFKVTEAGYKVAEQAELLLTKAAEFQSQSLQARETQAIEVKIGISRSLAPKYLNTLLKELRAQFPNLTAKVNFGTTNAIIESIADGSLDIGITIGTLNLPTLTQTVVKKGQFVLAEGGPKKNWLKPIKEKFFILTEPRSETEKLKASYNKEFSKAFPQLFEINSWDVIGELVQSGLGVGLLPDVVVNDWKEGSYQILKTNWFQSSYEIYIHKLKTKATSRVLAVANDIF
ncbi:MAG: LysR family transcriptional regulator [Pseudobdellovibrio sp.]|nr:LysR family transcriptional regulator [Pseudobdellovibrio sp.]